MSRPAFTRRFHRGRSSAVIAAVAGVCALGGLARANTYTWIPNSGSGDDDWSDSRNWVNGNTPQGLNTDVIDFNDDGSTPYTSINNLSSPTVLNTLNLDNNSSATETLEGNGLSLQGTEPTIDDNGSGNFMLNFGTIQIEPGGEQILNIGGDGSGVVTFGSTIIGSGLIDFSGSGTYVLNNQNTFSAVVDVLGGVLQAGTINTGNTNGYFGNEDPDSDNIRYYNNGTIELTDPTGSTNLGITLEEGGGTLQIDAGQIEIDGQIVAVTAVDSADNVLTKTGVGNLILGGSSDNSYLGITVADGTLFLEKTSSSSVHAVGGPLTIDSGTEVMDEGTGDNQLYSGVTVTDNGTWNMYGDDETISALSGTGTVIDTASFPSTLTVGLNGSSTFTGTLFGGAIGVLTLNVAGTGSLTIGGTADNNSLGANVTGGTLVLAKTSSSTVHAIGGPLMIGTAGTVQISGAGNQQIYMNVNVTDNGTLDLNGQSVAFNELLGSGTVTNTSTNTDGNLTIGQNTTAGNSYSFTGPIVWGPSQISVNLTETGNGTLTLGGTSDNSGLGVTVESGELILAKTSGANVHTIGGGGLTIDSGAVVQEAGSGGAQIYQGAYVTDNGTYDLNGQSDSFTNLFGSGTVINSSTTSST
ncbi:MAG TPA: hypothetical protein VL992_20855, partial [Tepidisphaeraceae bacterium]|nr:hypothetical protein [Tepidisphaeraceae bacterium]